MEAAVNSRDAGLEVQKLQELVRRLELQNEQLRSRSTGDGVGVSVLDEVELLDLDSLSDSEDTWLYVAPTRAGRTQGEPMSPLRWCRNIQDGSKSELEARRSLGSPAEGVWRWTRSSPAPSSRVTSSPSPAPSSRVTSSPSPAPSSRVTSSPSPAPSSRVTSSPIASTQPCPTPPQTERRAGRAAHPPLSSPLHPVLQRSLSPIGTERSASAGTTPTFIPHLAGRSCGRRRPGLGSLCSADSDLGSSELDDSSALSYKLQDLTDVQVMARLQEESLRKRLVSASSSCALLSDGCLLQDEEDYGLSRHSLLARLPHSHTFCSTRGWRRSPPPSTPPHLSAGFSFLGPPPARCLCSGSLQASDKLQRSLPDLPDAPSIPSVPRASPALLCTNHSFDSCSLAHLHWPTCLLSPFPSADGFRRLTSVGCSSLLRASSGAPIHSPTRCGVPRPSLVRSPRSVDRIGAKPSARSFLTPPRILSSGGALRACY